MPQVESLIACIAMKVPFVGVPCVLVLSPQHSTLPVVVIPQLWYAPEVSAVKVPEGVLLLTVEYPQHSTPPVVSIAQLW